MTGLTAWAPRRLPETLLENLALTRPAVVRRGVSLGQSTQNRFRHPVTKGLRSETNARSQLTVPKGAGLLLKSKSVKTAHFFESKFNEINRFDNHIKGTSPARQASANLLC
jgi:hypothetical protein